MSVWFKHTSSVKVQLQYSTYFQVLKFSLPFLHSVTFIIRSVSHLINLLLSVLSVLVCCCVNYLLLSDCAVSFTMLVSLLISCCIVSSWSIKKDLYYHSEYSMIRIFFSAASTSSFSLTTHTSTILFIQVPPFLLSKFILILPPSLSLLYPLFLRILSLGP